MDDNVERSRLTIDEPEKKNVSTVLCNSVANSRLGYLPSRHYCNPRIFLSRNCEINSSWHREKYLNYRALVNRCKSGLWWGQVVLLRGFWSRGVVTREFGNCTIIMRKVWTEHVTRVTLCLADAVTLFFPWDAYWQRNVFEAIAGQWWYSIHKKFILKAKTNACNVRGPWRARSKCGAKLQTESKLIPILQRFR